MNITLKKVPPELHQRLKTEAAKSGRSLNRHIIFTLETSPEPQKSRTELFEKIRQRRNQMTCYLTQKELEAAINDGRE